MNIVYALFCRFAEIIFGILVLIMTSRLFGLEGRGVFSAGMAVSGLFGILCSINLSRGLYSDICSCGKSVDEYVKKLFLTVVVLVSSTSAFGVLAYTLIYLYGVKFFTNMPVVIVLLFGLYVPSLIWTNVANTLYSSLGIIAIKNNINLLTKTIFSVTVALIYFFSELTLILFCGLFVIFAIINMIIEGLLLKYRYAADYVVDLASVKRLVQKSISWYPDLVGGYMISGATPAFVVYYLSVKEVGIFGVAMQIFSIGFMLVPAVLQLYVSGDITKYGPEKSMNSIFKYIKYYTIYFVFAYLALSLLGGIVLVRLLGAEFIEALSLLKIMAIAGWVSGVVLLLAPLWTAMNYTKFVTINTMLLGAISFLVLTLMIGQYRLYGAAWGMVIIFAIALIGNIFLLKHTFRKFSNG